MIEYDPTTKNTNPNRIKLSDKLCKIKSKDRKVLKDFLTLHNLFATDRGIEPLLPEQKSGVLTTRRIGILTVLRPQQSIFNDFNT